MRPGDRRRRLPGATPVQSSLRCGAGGDPHQDHSVRSWASDSIRGGRLLGVAGDVHERRGEAAVQTGMPPSGRGHAAETPGTISQGTPAAPGPAPPRRRGRRQRDLRLQAHHALAPQRGGSPPARSFLLDRMASRALAHVGPAGLRSVAEGCAVEGACRARVRGPQPIDGAIVSRSGRPTRAHCETNLPRGLR